MEVVGVVFIAPNHFLAIVFFPPTADGPCPLPGRSTLAHQRLKTQWSAVTAIPTATVHLMRRQMLGTTVADDPAMHPRQSARTLKFILSNPLPSGFLVLHRPDGPRLRPDGPRLVSDGARFSIGRFIVLTYVFVVFLSVEHPDVVDGPPQGPRRSAHRCFSNNILLPRIIYGIPDSRLSIVVDELMHLRNDHFKQTS
jgi:hypothetical protein